MGGMVNTVDYKTPENCQFEPLENDQIPLTPVIVKHQPIPTCHVPK